MLLKVEPIEKYSGLIGIRTHDFPTCNIVVRLEVFTAVTMKIASSGMLRRVALVRADVSEELSASFIRVTRIGELGTTLAVTSIRRTR
jgi:hypothetical protein